MPKTAQPDEQTLQQDMDNLVVPYIPNPNNGIVVYPEVVTPEDKVIASEIGKKAKAMMKEVEAGYDDLIADAHSLHSALIAKKKKYWNPFNNLALAVARRITEYHDREERKRQETERLLREQAQKEEQDRLLHEAAMLEKTGNQEEAQIVMDEAVRTPQPLVVAPSTVPKVDGVYSRKGQWKFRIKDQSKIKSEYFCPDLDAIGAVVKAKGPLAVKMIGDGSIEVFQESSTVIRG